MQTACLLRRSWLHLHTVCRGIVVVGSSCAPSWRRNSQNFIYIVGERFFSGSSGYPRTISPFIGYGKHSVSPFASSRYQSWSSDRFVSHHEEGFKFFTSDFRRSTGVYGFFSSEDESGRRQGTPSSCKSKSWSELVVHGKQEEEEEEEEVKDNDCLKMSEWGDTKNGCESLQGQDEDRRHFTMCDESREPWRNFGSRELSVYPTPTAELARRVFPGSNGLGGNFLCFTPSHYRSYSSVGAPPAKPDSNVGDADKAETKAFDNSHRAVVTALVCNFLVFSLKLGVWIMTSSHVMLAEAIHSLADLANQGLIAYGLISSRRAPDAIHPYGYTKERFVWSLISAVGIFCLGSGATIIHGVQNLWNAEPLENIHLAALVIGGSMVMEGASLLVAISCVRNGAKAEGMTVKDYLWRGHDPTSVAVMMEDSAAVTGLAIAGVALSAAHYTGNPIWDPIGSIVVGNLLGAVAIFLIQRNRHALLGRSMDEEDMMRVLNLLSKDPVVDAIYDCKSEVIGPGAYRFKAEIDFNGVNIVQNYIRRAGRGTWHKEFQDAVSSAEPGHLDRVMAAYGEEVVSALGGEVDRLEREIQKVVPGIRHVDIEAHNPNGPLPREKLYLPYRSQIN